MASHSRIFGATENMFAFSCQLPLLLRPAFVALLLTCICGSEVRAQKTSFDVLKGDDVVGKILASRSVAGDRTTYLMTSFSEFDIIWKQTVKSVAATEYVDGSLRSCHTNMSVNGTLRDSSRMHAVDDETHCFVHPDQRFLCDGTVEWTTARMYFEEPVDQKTIFVESVLKHCPLVRVAPGLYRLTMPGDKVNSYAYKNGVLQEIHVDRSFFDLVFRRV